MRLRLIAPVLLVTAVTVGAFALTRMESLRDADLVLAGGLALAAVTGVLVATTDRRRRATRETERFFALSPEMVICAGFDGFWKRVNPAVEVVLGYTEAEALGLPFMELIHPDDRERSEEEAARVMAGVTALAFENRILCKDGTYKWIEWTATPVPEERLMYTIGRDVSERRRSESEEIALRRLATLIAEGQPPTEIFSAVSKEVGRLFDSDLTVVARFDPDGPATVVMGLAKDLPELPVGSRWELEDGLAAARVYRTGRSARIDAVDRSSMKTPIGAVGRRLGVVSTVSCPIHVEGRLWGTITVPAKEPLPPDTEERLEKFTQVVATAIANADSREAVARLADEQAALRRVATLVARDAPSNEVFESVATEVGTLFDTDITIVGRYDDDGMATAIGNWSASPGGVPAGTRSAIGGRNLLTMVAETGKPARIDGYDDSSGEAAEIARRHGWQSSIAAPIVVEGRLWGVMLVASQRPDPFPLGAEERLAAFTDLVATALANAQAHGEVLRFGDEQAALGRVATLVAGGAAPERVFTAVVEEVSSLLEVERIALVRYDGNATVTVIAASGDHPFPAGSTLALDDPSVMALVARTKRAARIDDYSTLTGEVARAAHGAGLRSAIGAPITIEGRLWGAIIASSTDPEPIPDRSEARLTQFTELVATAVANAEARHALERVAAEQAALRRVATLVALGTGAEPVLRAVCDEVRALLSADMAGILRFHNDRTVTVMADSGGGQHQVGARVSFDPGFVVDWVHETHQAARFDRDDPDAAQMPEIVRMLGLRSAVASPIVVDGELWGTITLASLDRSLPTGMERRLAEFTELVATAIANAESKSALNASRRRIVAASDETRRRIERDLHDGTQQGLVSLGLAVRAAEANLPPERDDLRAELSGVAQGLTAAVEELQELSRGIHPAILSKGGLGPALRTLAHRSAIPVDLDVSTDDRLAEPIEVAAYFVASEALANAAKHSEASRVDLSLARRDSSLVLSVRDDGVGGADAGRGSGLVGLTDRVEALGGSIRVSSRPGEGTQITAELPLELDVPQAAG